VTFRSQFTHRDDLLRAALDEFCERGFDAASINTILTNASVSKGQFYHHFRNKEGLYLAVVEWMIDHRIEWLAEHPPDTALDDFFASLAGHIQAAVAFAAEHPDVDRFTRSLLTERGHPIFEAVVERFGFTGDGPLGALVEHHHGQGEFRSDLPLDFIQRFVELMVNRAPDLLAIDEPSAMTQGVNKLMLILRDGCGRQR